PRRVDQTMVVDGSDGGKCIRARLRGDELWLECALCSRSRNLGVDMRPTHRALRTEHDEETEERKNSSEAAHSQRVQLLTEGGEAFAHVTCWRQTPPQRPMPLSEAWASFNDYDASTVLR